MDNLGIHLKYKNPIRVMTDGEKLKLQKDALVIHLSRRINRFIEECVLVQKTGVAYRLQENIAPEKFSPTYVLIGGYFIQDNRAKVMARRLTLVALLQKDYTEYAEELTARSPLI